MTKAGYESYKLYLALQRHFSTDYDFFKYHGKVRASVEAYEKRSDKFSFEKLVKILDSQFHTDFYVSHFLDNPREWVKNMSKSKWEGYKATYKNLPTKFKEDLQYIKMIGPGSAIKYDRDIPIIHEKVINNTISKESVILLDSLFPFIDKHDKEIDIGFVWPEHIQSLKKYRPFVLKKTETNYNIFTETAKEVLL